MLFRSLPGSCIGRVYEEARKAHQEILDGAGKLQGQALAALTDQPGEHAVTVWNSLSFARTVLVELPEAFAAGVQTLEGEAVMAQCSSGQVRALVTVPPCGAVALIPADGSAELGDAAVSVEQCEAGYILENRLVRAVVDHRGEITSFVLKESGREFASGPMNRFRLYKDVPRMFDAWDIDSNYIEQDRKSVV